MHSGSGSAKAKVTDPAVQCTIKGGGARGFSCRAIAHPPATTSLLLLFYANNVRHKVDNTVYKYGSNNIS
jgi:hypothetical protein